ncbi:MAG TPA: hypothetical protein VFN25_01685, partial [Dokdonella sp.]|uniref:hypothetical protein n=1 Tax=Dokdonella sp. TaxID=2291710 RepID=UPI002D7EE3C0
MVRKWLGISFAVALGAACLPAYANEGSSDAVPPAYNHNYYNAPGPDLASGDSDAPNGVVGTFLFISGNAFTPLTGTQSVSNSGYGCSASYATLTTDLTLPDAAEVTGIRVYYYNDGSPNNFITVRLIAYTGDGSDTTYITGFAGDDNGY